MGVHYVLDQSPIFERKEQVIKLPHSIYFVTYFFDCGHFLTRDNTPS